MTKLGSLATLVLMLGTAGCMGAEEEEHMLSIEHYKVPEFSRLATVVKQAKEEFLQIYLYREIEGDEFAPLLPGSKVQVGWFDRLMMLAAGQGHFIHIEASGENAKAAIQALVALVEDGFGEED